MRALSLLLLYIAPTSFGITLFDGEKAEQFADKRLSQKLERVYLSPDNTSIQFSKLVGLDKSQTFNQDGTAFSANLTGSHDSPESLCLRWAGPRNCVDWLAPYVPNPNTHPKSERSAEEDVVLTAYEETKGNRGGNGQYAFWNVKARSNANGGSYLRPDGSLNMEAIGSMEIQENYKNKLEKVGERTGEKSLQWTFDTETEAKEKNALGNIESQRAIAASLTLAWRNRNVDIVRRARSVKPGMEVLQGINITNCEAYAGAVSEDFDRYREMKTDPQRNLASKTRNTSLQKRIEFCKQAQKMNIYAANVGVYDGEVQAGDKNGARIDEALAQAQLLVIDKVGSDPSQAPLPEGLQITEENKKSTIAECEVGGLKCKDVRQNNSTDLKQYNRDMREAKQSIKAMAAANPFINAAQADDLDKWQIKEGQMNAVTLNGLTPEMRNRIRDTGSPMAQGKLEIDPGSNLEQSPIDLVVTSSKNGL